MITKNQVRLLALGLAGATSLPLAAATVSPTDPVPNTPGPPADGGIGYHWTAKMNSKDRADLHGTVGAWSWDEDGFPETAKGWTHTSNWIALELEADCRLTIQIQRKAGVPTTVTMNNPDGVGLFNLYPALTVYQRWQETGGDSHNFNNRGNIAWAGQIAYLTHFENGGGHVIEATLKLKAGRYSVVLGGNSPSTLAEGRQGYGATLTTEPYHDPAGITVSGKRMSTRKASYRLRGRVLNSENLASVQVRHAGLTTRAKVKGRSWTARVTGLKARRNVVVLTALSRDGSTSRPVRVVIDRIVPAKAKPKPIRSPFGFRN